MIKKLIRIIKYKLHRINQIFSEYNKLKSCNTVFTALFIANSNESWVTKDADISDLLITSLDFFITSFVIYFKVLILTTWWNCFWILKLQGFFQRVKGYGTFWGHLYDSCVVSIQIFNYNIIKSILMVVYFLLTVNLCAPC